MAHREIAFIPLNDGHKHRPQKPWFAISALHWTAKAAREEMTDAWPSLPPNVAWRKLKADGWRIVKVSVSQIGACR